VHEDLSDTAKERWRSALRQKLASSSLEFESLPQLKRALQLLDDKEAEVFFVEWMRNTKEWKSWKPEGLASLAQSLSGRSEAATLSQRELAQHAESTFFGNELAMREAGIRQWGDLARGLLGGLPPSQRVKWAMKLRAAFAKDPSLLTTTCRGDIGQLCGALESLGDPTTGDLVAAWLLKNPKWSEGGFHALKGLIHRRMDGSGDDQKAARRQIASYLDGNCFKSYEDIRKIQLRDWAQMLTLLSPDLTPDERTRWATAIRRAHAADDAAIVALKAEEVGPLCDAMAPADKNDAGQVASTWLNGRPSWKEIPVRWLMRLASAALPVQQDEGKALVTKLENELTARDLAFRDCRTVSRAYADDMADRAKAQAWLLRGYQVGFSTAEARAALAPDDVFWHAHDLYVRGLTSKTKGYKNWALAVAELIKAGKLGQFVGEGPVFFSFAGVNHDHYFYGRPLCTEESRNVIKAELYDPEGNMRLTAAKILAWSYVSSGHGDEMKQLVESKLQQAGLEGDEKARWMMMKGYLAAMTWPDASPQRGVSAAKLAYGIAQSDVARMQAIKELCAYYTGTKRQNIAIGFIDSVKGQFGEAHQAELERLASVLTESHERDLARYEAEQARIALSRKVALLKKYNSRLAAAQAAGDAQKAATLQKAIADLEQ